MGPQGTEEFRLDAVRFARTRGLTRSQVVGDLGAGMPTLNIEHVQRYWFGCIRETSRRTETRTRCRKAIEVLPISGA